MNIWNIKIIDYWCNVDDISEVKISQFNPFHFIVIDIWSDRRTFLYNILEWWLDSDVIFHHINTILDKQWIDINTIDNWIWRYCIIDSSDPSKSHAFVRPMLPDLL